MNEVETYLTQSNTLLNVSCPFSTALCLQLHIDLFLLTSLVLEFMGRKVGNLSSDGKTSFPLLSWMAEEFYLELSALELCFVY